MSKISVKFRNTKAFAETFTIKDKGNNDQQVFSGNLDAGASTGVLSISANDLGQGQVSYRYDDNDFGDSEELNDGDTYDMF